jgi:hypothetical protein
LADFNETWFKHRPLVIESKNTFYRAGIPNRLQLAMQFLLSPEPLARSISESLGKVIKMLAYCYIMLQEGLKHIDGMFWTVRKTFNDVYLLV